MAGTLVGKDGIWTWFNTPKATRYGDSVYFGTFDRLRLRPVIYRVNVVTGDEIQSAYIQPGVGVNEFDDHDDPALLKLNSNKWLAAWSKHDGNNSYCATSSSMDISTFGTPVQITSAGTNTYFQLLQNSSNRIFAFTRILVAGVGTTTRSQHYRTSDDDGATWSTPATEFMREVDERPYFRWFQTNGNRFDFFFTNCGPGEGNMALYHGYLAFSGNTWTAHKTDGTLVGDVNNLPFSPSQFTLVRDATTDDWWIIDGRTYSSGGVITPVCTSQRAVRPTVNAQEYWRSKWNGSSWDSELIVRAAEAGVSTSIEPSASGPYTGLCALHPENSDVVCASRGYVADTDFRTELYTRGAGGTWSKTADLSGNTGDKNCRPITCSLDGTNACWMWWKGIYLDFDGAYDAVSNGFQTDIYMYPPLPNLRTAKAPTPTLDTGFAPVGSKLILPFQEGSGTPVDLRGTYTGTTVGTLTWTSTAFGYHVSNFSDSGSRYYTFDALGAAFAAGAYPKWVAVLFDNSSGTLSLVPFSIGSSAGPNPYFYVALNQGAPGTIAFNYRNDAGTTSLVLTKASTNSNNGSKHVLMGLSSSAAIHNLIYDGVSEASSSTSIAGITLNQASVGVLRRDTISAPFGGNIYAVLVGWGGVPNPADLYYDLVNGRFSGMGGAEPLDSFPVFDPEDPVVAGVINPWGEFDLRRFIHQRRKR